jgi:hypothetical protein
MPEPDEKKYHIVFAFSSRAIELDLTVEEIAQFISGVNTSKTAISVKTYVIFPNRLSYIEDPENGFDKGFVFLEQKIKESKEKAEALRVAEAQKAEEDAIKTTDQHSPNEA